jgi:tripartite-type tricarboxylate transporter receptor subunit TctC
MKLAAVASTSRLLCVLTCVLTIGASAVSIQAADFPTREIELVVPFSPGGSTDTVSRIVGPKVADHLRVPVVVVNKPGGATVIGTNYVLTSPPDGYKILAGGNTNMGSILAVGQKAPYQLRDLAGLARATVNPLILVAKKGRFENLDALIREAKQKPGGLTFASWGAKSPSHFYGELLNQVTGMKMKHIAFEGGAKAMVAAMGGHADIAIVTVATAKSNVKGDTLAALAVTSEQRVDDLAVPSIKELGYPDAVYVSFDGFVASAKVPKDRLDILRAAFERSMSDPQVKEALKKAGGEPGYLTGPDYDVFLAKNLDTLRRVAAKAGIEE